MSEEINLKELIDFARWSLKNALDKIIKERFNYQYVTAMSKTQKNRLDPSYRGLDISPEKFIKIINLLSFGTPPEEVSKIMKIPLWKILLCQKKIDKEDYCKWNGKY
jgi:hypothetical protein